MGYSVVNIEDIEGAGPSGAVKFVRRELGVEAFGVNWFEIAIADPEGMTFVAIGARRGSYEARGLF